MGIFDRFRRVVKSNLNDMISKAENPEKMLNQLIVEGQIYGGFAHGIGGRSPSRTRIRYSPVSVRPPSPLSRSRVSGSTAASGGASR